jgi:hypothetical protein
MQRKNIDENNSKTAVLLGVMNFISFPISGIAFGFRLSVAILIFENILALYLLHERGKDERKIENLVVNGSSLFGSWIKQTESSSKIVKRIEANKIENSIQNISAGGAALVDEISSFISKKNSR